MAKVNHNVIAKKLNLSRATVSRSLSNHPAISAETRARVISAAEELGYRPSPGRALRNRGRNSRRLTIGVLIGLEVPAEKAVLTTYPHILKGIRERAEIERVQIDVHYQAPVAFHPETSPQEFFRQIRNGGWRGALLIYPFAEAAVEVIASKISTVGILESYNHPAVDVIDTDDASAFCSLVETLRAAGHRRIGFMSWDYQIGGHWIARRFSGYVEALFLNDLEFNPDWVLNVRPTSGRVPRDQLADVIAKRIREDGVTAWVCAADHQAYPLIRDLQQRGFRIPHDCAVTGFDGLEPPAGLPRVTSMRVPHEHIGASALSRLISRIQHPTSPRRKILVEAQLVTGQTAIAPVAVPAAR
jgi:LacI family transcriptional regulator